MIFKLCAAVCLLGIACGISPSGQSSSVITSPEQLSTPKGLLEYLSIPPHGTGSAEERFATIAAGLHYSEILARFRAQAYAHRAGVECGEVVGLQVYVDHLIAWDEGQNSRSHTQSGEGAVYAFFYKGKRDTGEVDPAIRAALVTVPLDQAAKPLLMFGREFIGDMSYAHLTDPVADLQHHDFVVASAVYPGEHLPQKQDGSKYFSQPGIRGSATYDADVWDFLTLHACVQKANQQKSIPLNKAVHLTQEVPNARFVLSPNPLFHRLCLHGTTESAQTLYSGYSRGGTVAVLAAATLGALEAERVPTMLHVSGLAPVSPLGTWMASDELEPAAFGRSKDPGKNQIHLTLIRHLWQREPSLRTEDYADRLAQRDLAFLAPYLRLTLRRWAALLHEDPFPKPGVHALIMHVEDPTFDYPSQHAIVSCMTQWKEDKVRMLTGAKGILPPPFVYAPCPLMGGLEKHGREIFDTAHLLRPTAWAAPLPCKYVEGRLQLEALFVQAWKRQDTLSFASDELPLGARSVLHATLRAMRNVLFDSPAPSE